VGFISLVFYSLTLYPTFRIFTSVPSFCRISYVMASVQNRYSCGQITRMPLTEGKFKNAFLETCKRHCYALYFLLCVYNVTILVDFFQLETLSSALYTALLMKQRHGSCVLLLLVLHLTDNFTEAYWVWWRRLDRLSLLRWRIFGFHSTKGLKISSFVN
jgi:hypothetical protein